MSLSTSSQWARVEEATLLMSFDSLERAVRAIDAVPEAQRSKRLYRALCKVREALRLHSSTLGVATWAEAEDDVAGTTPATIDRRRDKLATAIREYVLRARILARLAQAAETHCHRDSAQAEVAALEREAAELLQALRDFHAKEQALIIDRVTLEVGVGD